MYALQTLSINQSMKEGRDESNESMNQALGGMEKSGLSSTVCNPPKFQHDYEEISARLQKISI
jgi:hypothetical protein